MKERMIIIGIAYILDLLFGDPQNLWHPICAIGKFISKLETMLRKKFCLREGREEDASKKLVAGAILVALVLLGTLLTTGLLLYLAGRIHKVFGTLLSILICYQMLAAHCLRKESMKVQQALEHGSIEEARTAVSMIVGRDTQSLDADGVTRAAVETVAENTSDGVIAPLFYMFLFGPLGGVCYKAINTMDSMLGYRNDRYLYFGRTAAKLDDLANWIPARLSAWLMILASAILGMDVRGAVHIYKRDCGKHASPNSAHTEAACAGALQIQLAGPASYGGVYYDKPTIGDPIRPICPSDITRANRLMYMTTFLTMILGILGCIFLSII